MRWQQHFWENALPAALTKTRGATPFDFLALSLPGRQFVHFSALHPRSAWSRYETAEGKVAPADTTTPDLPGVASAVERAAAWGVPMLITGAGTATDDDAARCAFLLDLAEAVLTCRAAGQPLMGLCYRSLLDGFEWRHGFTQRFGLIHVDRKSLVRTPNPSAFLFQDIAKYDAIRPGAVARFCPDWQARLAEAS